MRGDPVGRPSIRNRPEGSVTALLRTVIPPPNPMTSRSTPAAAILASVPLTTLPSTTPGPCAHKAGTAQRIKTIKRKTGRRMERSAGLTTELIGFMWKIILPGSSKPLAAVGAEFLAGDGGGPTGRAAGKTGRRLRRGSRGELSPAHRDFFLDLLVDVLFGPQLIQFLQNQACLRLITGSQAAVIGIGQPAHLVFELEVLDVAVDNGLAVEQPVELRFGEKLHVQVPFGFPEERRQDV